MQLIVTLLLLAFASFALLVAVPKVARRSAVYMIHDVREQVYALGAAVPGAQQTALYKDLLFMCAASLRTVREGRIREILGLAVALTDAELSAGRRGSGAKLDPVFQTENGRRELIRMGCRLRQVSNAAWWASAWSSPVALVLVAPFYLVFFLALRPRRRVLDSALARTERPEGDVIAQAKEAANTLYQRPSLSQVLAATIRHAHAA